MKEEFLSGRKIWLASRSPRRKELLSRITPDFTVKVSRFDEAPLMAQAGSVPPEELVKALSAGKARAVWEETGGIVLADDSGLVVDYIGGEPGIYSARYMGEDTSYAVKNQVIIERLKGAQGNERSARFVCNIAAVLPDGSVLHTEKTMEGLIAEEPAGDGGFGYDPILYIPEFGKTSAQLTIEEKNRISHRGKALEAMKEELRARFGGEER